MTVAAAPEVVTSPFKGLTPFDDSDRDAVLFFGREREREVIAANLLASRLTVLYGASGVGKSSVLRAGVAHHLRGLAKRNLETRGHPEFVVVVFDSWTQDPVASLLDEVEAELREMFGPDLVTGERAATPTDTLHDWSDLLDCDLLLVLDQTEEYFLYHEHEEGVGTLAGELPDLVTRPGLRVSVLLAIRDDALSRLDRFKARIPNLFANYLRLDHLDRRAGRAAILGPIEQYNALGSGPGAAIEPELVEALLDETTAGRVVLGQRGRGVVRQNGARTRVEAAYLQLVLHRLWEEEAAAGSNVLRLETLERLGGAEEVVRTHLERALGELTPEDKDVAADVFSHLVTPSGMKIAHGIHDLAQYAHVREERLAPIVSLLVTERILRPVAKPQNGANGSGDASPYEIFHDVLGDAVLAWRTTHESERRVAQERAEADRRHRRILAVLLISFVALAAMTAVAAYAIAQRAEASRQAERATEQAAIAEQERANAEEQEAKAIKESEAAAAAQEEAEAQRDNARQAEAEAETQEQRAEAQEAVAVQERDEAERQREAAGRARSRAEGLAAEAQRERASAVTERGKAVAEKRVAERQRTLARAGQYTALAQAALTRDPVQSIQYALQAASLTPRSAQAESVLRDGLLAVRLRAELSGGGPLAGAVFSGDGATLATAASTGLVRIFRITAGGGPSFRTLQQGGSGVRPSLVRTLRHTAAVETIAFSPDARLVAVGGADGKVAVWDVASGFPRTQHSHADDVTWVEFSPDGRVLVTASADRTVRTWDVATGLPLHTLEHPTGVRSARFSPDSRLLVTAPTVRDRFARVFEVASGRPVAQLVHGGVVTSAQFTPDGSRVVSTGTRNLFIWERSTWTLRHPPLTGHTTAVHGAVVRPDSRQVLTYDDSGTARLWQIESGDIVTVIQRHDNEINDAAFQPGPAGDSIVTGSTDTTARVWDGRSGVVQATLAGHREDVTTATYHPSGRWILTASLDGTARLWDETFEPTLVELGRHAGGGAIAAVTPDGRLVASGGSDGGVQIRRVDGTLVRTLAHGGRINVVLFSSAGARLLTASEDGTARLWRVEGWRLLRTYVHGSPVRFASLSRDGSRVATGAADRSVKTWASGAEPVHTLRHAAILSSVVLHPAGTVLLTTALDGTGRLWSTASGAELRVLRHEDAIRAAAMSPDGTRVATASADGTARLWNTQTGALLHKLEGHREELTAVAFSADGRRLVTAAANGHLRTWNVSSGKGLATFRGHVATVFGVAFSRDGRWVVSAGPSAAGIWIAENGNRMYFLRGHAANLSTAVFSRNSRRVVTSGADGTVRTYVCDVCGNLAELRSLARRRLGQITRVGFGD